MSSSYMIPNLEEGTFHRCETVIKRSRFVASLAHAPTPEAAKSFVERIKAEFPDANHNCWAFVAGPAGHTGRVGYSDDGEPHGTAGRPMLTALLYSGVGELCAVVTRYFGGIKLGTGGLVRAYQGSTTLGLESLPVCEYRRLRRVEIVLDYPNITLFLRLLPGFKATIVDETFGVDAVYVVALPEERIAEFEAALMELADGAILISLLPDPDDAPLPITG